MRFWDLAPNRPARNERLTTRWCGKCGSWVKHATKNHRCDGADYAPKFRWCAACEKSIRTNVKRHGCDDAVVEVDDTAPLKWCPHCKDRWPLTKSFWQSNGPGRWRTECKACTADQRLARRVRGQGSDREDAPDDAERPAGLREADRLDDIVRDDLRNRPVLPAQAVHEDSLRH